MSYLSQSCALHLVMDDLDLAVCGQKLAPPGGPSACSGWCGSWGSCWQSPLGLFIQFCSLVKLRWSLGSLGQWS